MDIIRKIADKGTEMVVFHYTPDNEWGKIKGGAMEREGVLFVKSIWSY
ncbi:hypothetical protein J2S74_002556 [Evansella vedderi]|uniref:Uncharacterized protein n=1 Tax=Evansella vedderi TaxID=38282 RepID=A0ABT9ZWC9_9BACI|nr:hypothetical protein [Evansella vedderi]MDQ0255174.1 hypothetical protein [Evansella vedderi]